MCLQHDHHWNLISCCESTSHTSNIFTKIDPRLFQLPLFCKHSGRQTDRQTDRQTESQSENTVILPTYRQTDRQTDRQTESQSENITTDNLGWGNKQVSYRKQFARQRLCTWNVLRHGAPHLDWGRGWPIEKHNPSTRVISPLCVKQYERNYEHPPEKCYSSRLSFQGHSTHWNWHRLIGCHFPQTTAATSISTAQRL